MSRKDDTRRRTGCLQCKEKHLRCTEEQPRCRRCETLGLPCKRDLKLTFREDAVQRGLAFGREGIWTKRPPSKARNSAVFRPIPLHSYINRWIFLNVAIEDFEKQDRENPSDSEFDRYSKHEFLTTTPFLLPSYHAHPLHTFPETDAYLLDYFIRGISPSCSLSTSHNPYISLVIPLSFSSDTLRNALLAVAANQLCLLGQPSLRQEACHYKHKTLQGLRQQIALNSHDEGTIATVLMLCFQDISDGCSSSWLTHLRGGMRLLSFDKALPVASPSLWGFFRMYFIAHDIMSRTASEEDDEDDTQLWAEGEDLEEIDVLMGCSRGLMSLIHRISTLASAKAKISRSRHLTASETQYYAIATSEMHQALMSLKQTLPAHSHSRNDLEQIAHIKKLTAQLYLTERLGPLSRSKDSHEPGARDTPSLPPSRASLMTTLVSTISALTETTASNHINKNINLATLLWPLFILGNASLENEEHRRFVLDGLTGIQRARNLGSVRRAIDAVKHVFGMGGLNDRSKSRAKWGSDKWRGISLA